MRFSNAYLLYIFQTVNDTVVDLVSDSVVKLEQRGDVDISRVWALGSVRCTNHQLLQAKLHAKQAFPGCAVAPTINSHAGLSKERAEFVEKFLHCPTVSETVEASLVNNSKGVKYRLKQGPWVLWHRLREEMVSAFLKPVSWGYFYSLTNSNKYELRTADNCCCGICRENGFDNYDELRSIVELIDKLVRCATNDAKGLPNKQKLLQRINKEEEFRSGVYATHLESESNIGTHCKQLLLSASNDSRFRKPCTHGGAGCGTMPEPWDRIIQARYRRKAKSSDWNGVCGVCNGQRHGNVYCCYYCNVTVHPECSKFAHNDLPFGKKDTWTCWDCVQEIDSVQHVSSCNQCNEAGFLVCDVKAGIDLVGYYEKLISSSANTSTSTSSEGDDHGDSDICRHAVASELLYARLQIFEGKQQHYHAHLIRDQNQSRFKDLSLDTLPLSSFYLLVDYWAKINIAKKGGTFVL